MLPTEKSEQVELLRHGPTNYSFKSFIAQFLATMASSTMFLSVGMMLAEATILIMALPSMNPEFQLNSDQLTSIYRSQLFGKQPLGCVVGAALQNIVGRKTGMVLTSISALSSWVLLQAAPSADTLYLSATMMGVSAGLIYAPGLAYIAEITEPRFRGAMTAFAYTTLPIGMLIVFFLGSSVDWRTISALSCSVPVISIIMFTFIPDSPLRLLEQGKSVDALQALRWLRGWTSEAAVKLEFDDMCSYAETPRNTLTRTPKRSVVDFVRNGISTFFDGKLLKLFGFISLYRVFSNCVTFYGAQKHLLQVSATLGIPVDLLRLLPILSNGFTILGGLSCCMSVKFMRRRKLSVISILVCLVDVILLGAYAYYKDSIQLPWMPLVLLCSVYFFNALGIGSVLWMLIGEIFPIRNRSLGIGLSTAIFCFIDSIFTENHPKLEYIFGLPGCLFLYGIGGLIGFAYLYKYLPETEGKQLRETEKSLFATKIIKPRSSTLWSSILKH